MTMYTTDLELSWSMNPGAVGVLCADDYQAIHSDAHSKRPPCTGWEDAGSGKPLPLRVVYLIEGHTNYPKAY